MRAGDQHPAGRYGRRPLPWQRHSRGEARPVFRRSVVRPVLLFMIGRLGIPVGGNQLLITRDQTGKQHTSGITPWSFEGRRYLISGKGERSQWVRLLRAEGKAQLRVGRHIEKIVVEELGFEEKLPILRWYATKRLEVESDEELVARAPDLPVFRVLPG